MWQQAKTKVMGETAQVHDVGTIVSDRGIGANTKTRLS